MAECNLPSLSHAEVQAWVRRGGGLILSLPERKHERIVKLRN